MSSVKFEASPKSRDDIESTAWAVRQLLGFTDPYLPVLELIEFGLGYVASGFHFDVGTSREMGDRHGLVHCGRRVLMLREDVYEGIAAGKGRDRFTGCHELGHVILHSGCLNRVLRKSKSAVFRDPEWQANAFASSILMPTSLVRDFDAVRDFTKEFGVTADAARVRLKILSQNSTDLTPTCYLHGAPL